jgi:DMSO/TMAO reductase YedYZ heme-binding membrane subunit
MMGIWMLVASSVIQALVLDARETKAFFWSLLVMGYAFSVALVIGGIAGADVFEPGRTPVTFTGFVAAVLGILGAFVATALTLSGARAAIRSATTPG